MDSSERELILRSARGDKRAFGDLYEIYMDPIYRFIYFRVTHELEAEDLTEEVFLRVWQALPRMVKDKEIHNFRAWLYRIARNLVVDHYRKKRLETDISEADFMIDPEIQPDISVQRDEESNKLISAILKLEEPLREVMVHRFVSGFSHAETAGLMGLNENHIRVLQYRALKKLRDWMYPDDAGESDQEFEI